MSLSRAPNKVGEEWLLVLEHNSVLPAGN